jgi:hypothetical protein
LKFLRYGNKNNSYVLPSDVFPVADEDGVQRYKLIGYVNLGTGTIHKNEQDAKVADDPYGSGEDERLLPPSKNERLWTR